MPKHFLKNQAFRLGLNGEGLKAELVKRLEAHLSGQTIGPDGLLSFGPGAASASSASDVLEETPQMPLQPPLASVESRFTVAVVVGGRPSRGSAAAALEGARTLITHLHTAPRGISNGAGNGASAAGALTGLAVEAFYVDTRGRAFQPLPSLQALVDQLKDSADVVFPTATDVGGAPGELQRLLEAAGVPFVGAGGDAVALADDRLASTERMAELGFPVLPMLALVAEDFPTPPEELGGGAGARVANGLVEAAVAAHAFISAGDEALVEPFVRDAVRFRLALLGSGGAGAAAEDAGGAGDVTGWRASNPVGLVAAVPTQEELVAAEHDILDAELELEAYICKKHAYNEAAVRAALADAREAAVSETGGLAFGDARARMLPHAYVRLHSPPRCPLELTGAMRDAAVALAQRMGLRDMAVVEGWARLNLPHPEEVAAAAAAQRERLRAQTPAKTTPKIEEIVNGRDTGALDPLDLELASPAEQGFPEEHLFNDVVPGTLRPKFLAEREEAQDQLEQMFRQPSADAVPPDPDAFDPATGCTFRTGSLVFTAVRPAPDLAPTSPLFQQAAELGLSHAAALRAVVSAAAVRAGRPPVAPAPPDSFEGSVLAPKFGPTWDDELDAQRDAEEAAYAAEQREVELVPLPETDPGSPFPRDRNPDEPLSAEDAVDFERQRQLLELLQIGLEANVDAIDAMDPDEFWGRFPDVRDRLLHLGSACEELRAAAAVSVEEVQEPPQRLRVWVLMGGDGAGRDASLASGLHVFRQLHSQPDLQAEAFLLVPRLSGENARERRRKLLQQRNEEIQLMGGPVGETGEDLLPQHLKLREIRAPLLPDESLPRRGIWALPYFLALRSSPHAVHEECEERLRMHDDLESRVPDPFLPLEEKLARMVRLAAREQAATAGLPAGTTWGADSPKTPPAAPVYMDVEQWAEAACRAGAVVFLAVHGTGVEDGALQDALTAMGVPHTGSPGAAALLAYDKAATADALTDLEVHGISTPPKQRLTAAELEGAAADTAAAEALFDRLREASGGSALCIKPVADGDGAGVARLDSAADLAQYAHALVQRTGVLPEGALGAPQPRSIVPMPTTPPAAFLVEPFILADSLEVAPGENGALRVRWTGRSRWLEVNIGLVGEAGAMRALTPTVFVPLQGGERLRLTPPPEEAVPAEVLAGVARRAELVADRLGLAGMASVDAFMNADTAELIVLEADVVPSLAPSAELLQQALAEEPPLFPCELAREALRLACLPRAQAPAVPGQDGKDEEADEADDAEDETFDDEFEDSERFVTANVGGKGVVGDMAGRAR
ncbi:hypothetical protein WJX81_006432 [Elliptochloris bilobata]|uniref:ATP-grasp domain-containing protein n=1 Tax=Elliptochloris bilobata TaxID=381761 RepID=A0AAW1SLU2_9CHLO